MHIRDNVSLLASTPMEKLAADGHWLRPLRPGEVADPEKLHNVIRETFCSAAKDPKHRFWVKMKYGSLDFVAKKLGILPELNLPVALHPVCLMIGPDIKVIAERETLAASSKMFEHLLLGGFAEAEQDKVQILLPPEMAVSPNAIPLAINALIDSQLPKNLDVNTCIDLALLFQYFQAEELFKASLAMIISFNLNIFDWITLLRLSDSLVDDLRLSNSLVDDLIAELSEKNAEYFLTECLRLSPEDVEDFGATPECNEAGKIIAIKGADRTVSMQRFALSLVNGANVPIPDELLDYLGADLNLLTSANLSYYKGSLESFLQRCPNLLRLQLPLSAKGDVLKLLHLVPGLQSLALRYCSDLEPDALKHLHLVPKLLSLDIRYCHRLEKDALKHLGLVRGLHRLNITRCVQLEPDALKHLIQVPGLQELDISACCQLEPNALEYLGQVAGLQSLIISWCNQLEADALKHLVLVSGLQNLVINWCTQLESDALKHLGKVAGLQRLNIRSCLQLERDALHHLSQVPGLQQLSIQSCTQLEADALEQLGWVRRLRSLNISDCTSLKENSLKQLIHTPLLNELVMSGCRSLFPFHIPKQLASYLRVIS